VIFSKRVIALRESATLKINAIANQLKQEGKSIIMISSELPEVLRLSDRIAVMCDGRITGIIDNKDADQNVIMNLATKFSDDLTTAN
jgi:ribose transport system ATP-binding protein